MEEKKEEISILKFILAIIILIIFISGIMVLSFYLIKDLNKQNIYIKFCKENPSFCYCNVYSCEFKTFSSKTCLNGNCSQLIKDNNTIKLCEIAKKLNDKEMLFKANC